MKKVLMLLVFFGIFVSSYEQTVTDIDGNVYNTVNIGTQTWMKENLKVTHYNDGVPLFDGNQSGAWASMQGYYWCYYDTNHLNNDLYGKLYNFPVVFYSPKICPLGWHVPTMADIDTLSSYFNSSTLGGDLKETGTSFWSSPNTGATNLSGFSGRGGGVRDYADGFDSLNLKGKWWINGIVNIGGEGYGNTYSLFANSTLLERSISYYRYGAAIRCIKDTGSFSINEIKKSKVSLSPNPFTQTTQITLPQTYQHITLALYDIQGKLLLQQNYTDTDKILLQRNKLNNGMYFLKLTLDGKWVETGKIVVSE